MGLLEGALSAPHEEEVGWREGRVTEEVSGGMRRKMERKVKTGGGKRGRVLS